MNQGKKSLKVSGQKTSTTNRPSTPEKNRKGVQQIIKSTTKMNFDPRQFVVAEYSERDIEIFKQIFDYFDLDDDGMLTPMDLRKAMMHYGGYHPKKNFIYQMMATYDYDQSGQINFKEFVKMMTLKPCQGDKVEDILRVFNQIDQDQKGYITNKDLHQLAQQLQQQLSIQEAEQIIKKCDPKNEGKITWEAFLAFNKRKQF